MQAVKVKEEKRPAPPLAETKGEKNAAYQKQRGGAEHQSETKAILKKNMHICILCQVHKKRKSSKKRRASTECHSVEAAIILNASKGAVRPLGIGAREYYSRQRPTRK